MARHGEKLKTNNLHHKQLYGYIHREDALHLESVKQEMFPDYDTIKAQLREQIRRCNLTMTQRE